MVVENTVEFIRRWFIQSLISTVSILAMMTASHAQEFTIKDVDVYYLSNERETASAFKLFPDNRFEWYLSVGSLDAYTKGVWKINQEGNLALISDPVEPKPYFKEIEADSIYEKMRCVPMPVKSKRQAIGATCTHPPSYPIFIQLQSNDKSIDWQDAKVGLRLGDDTEWIKSVDANGRVEFKEDSEHTEKNGVYGVSIQFPSKGITKRQSFPIGSGARKIVYQFQIADPRRFSMNSSILTHVTRENGNIGWLVIDGDLQKDWLFLKADSK